MCFEAVRVALPGLQGGYGYPYPYPTGPRGGWVYGRFEGGMGRKQGLRADFGVAEQSKITQIRV